MTEQLRESLSAAIDDEADAFELRRVLDEAKQDDDLREQWHRLHVLRDFMREDVHLYQPDLRNAIWEELNRPVAEDEISAELVLAAEFEGGQKHRSPWFGRLTGSAVAVAVAVLVMVNGGVFESPQSPQSPVDYAGSTQPGGASGLVPVMYQQAKPVDRQRQHGLMLLHYQQQAMNRSGVASFVKVATFRRSPAPASTVTNRQTGVEALPKK